MGQLELNILNYLNANKHWGMLFLSILIVAISFLHISVYGGRNYREDEVNSVHGALTKNPTEIVEWMSTDLHPPGWRLFADFWVDVFGTDEIIVRWSSNLINIMTFALLFQLSRQLLDWRLGVFSIILLGLYPALANAMNELRPYPMLIMLSIALHLIFYRWLYKPSSKLMILYVVLGISALYTHFFSLFIFASHFIFTIIFLKSNRIHWQHTAFMWVSIGLSFLGWVLPFLHTITVPFKGGIYYSLPKGVVGLELLINRLSFQPENIGYFLLLFGLVTPFITLSQPHHYPKSLKLRLPQHNTFTYPFILLIATVLIALFADTIVSSLTARNMLLITPLVVILMAIGLRYLPIQASLILLTILFIDSSRYLPIQTSNAPYREMITFMDESYISDSVLLTEFAEGWRWLTPAAYFMMDFTQDQMSKKRMFHIVDKNDNVYLAGNFPELLDNIYQNNISDELLQQIMPPANQLWHLQQGGGVISYQSEIQRWLQNNYSHLRTISWDDGYQTSYQLSEYARVPDNADLILNAGRSLMLEAWSLQDSVDVTPCQNITVESWWQTSIPTENPLQLTLILADDNSQLAIGEDFPANIYTTDWEADRYYRDQSQLTIPCNITTGSYNLLLGIKDSITGESLPLVYPDGNEIGKLYYLTTIHTKGS